jgi:putative transposase
MAQARYSFELMSYVIMDNHFHFIIRTVENGATIARIMQFIKAQFAQRCNRIMSRTGPFWNERYGDTIIEEQAFPAGAFNAINNYILQNPVRARCVKDARDYRYSSMRFYVDENYRPPVILTFHIHYLGTGRSFRERANRLLGYG